MLKLFQACWDSRFSGRLTSTKGRGFHGRINWYTNVSRRGNCSLLLENGRGCPHQLYGIEAQVKVGNSDSVSTGENALADKWAVAIHPSCDQMPTNLHHDDEVGRADAGIVVLIRHHAVDVCPFRESSTCASWSKCKDRKFCLSDSRDRSSGKRSGSGAL